MSRTPRFRYQTFFDQLEITTMSHLVESGDLTGIGDQDLERYARLAAISATGQAVPALADPFRRQLLQIMVGEGPDVSYDADGEMWLDDGDKQCQVTDALLRHLEWVVALFNDQGLAGRFLDLVPPTVRTEALTKATAHTN
jgi:hypothetical protein